MNNFQEILSGAPPIGEVPCPGYLAPAPPWLCPLSDFKLIRVSGKEAFNFLNNQLSNDLDEISQGRSQFNAYCNPKGRLYGVFHVFTDDKGYLLRTTASTLNLILNRLRLFVLRADVVLEEDLKLVGLGLIGNDGAHLLDKAGLPAPVAPFEIARHSAYVVIRTPGVCARYEIYAPPEKLVSAWNTLSPLTNPSAEIWRLYDILSGFANIHEQTSEMFVPQMVNLDLTGALSLSKGCYPGQEVVARMHYLGKLKQRMHRLSCGSFEVACGEPVFVPAYNTQQPSGNVVDTCRLPDGGGEYLATLRMQSLEQGEEIHLGAVDGPRARIQPLPYEVTADTQSGGDSSHPIQTELKS